MGKHLQGNQAWSNILDGITNGLGVKRLKQVVNLTSRWIVSILLVKGNDKFYCSVSELINLSFMI